MKFYILFLPNIFSHKKYSRNTFDLLKFISMEFFPLFGCWQESHWFYNFIFKKLHIIYQYCYQHLILLLGRISPGAIISHHLKIQCLGLGKDLTIWMFTVWESLFSNHKSESLIPQHIFILNIFQNFQKNVLSLQDISLTCNI